MGSGKSYEVTASVIVPAVAIGRRIVTNIDGISEAKIHEYLISNGKKPPFGSVIRVQNEQINQPNFFPDEEKPDIESTVLSGDLVAIDEAWRFWGVGLSIPTNHQQFFRMHRHYVHPVTGSASDVVLLVQSVSDLHRSLRSVIEMTARCTKLKVIGLSKSYRLELFEGDKITKTAKFDTFTRRYDPNIFPLYSSYSGGSGSETAIDARQNILKNPRIWILGTFIILLLFGCSYYVYHWFTARTLINEELIPPPSSVTTPMSLSTATSGQPGQVSTLSDLRVSGEVVLRGERWIVVTDATGRVRLENPALFVGSGPTMVGDVGGQRVSSWSGSVGRSQP